MEKSDKPRKVQGIIWNTEQDRLQVDVKVHFSRKKRGARLDPDVDLGVVVDDFVPRIIT
jgi:hypothetical protein